MKNIKTASFGITVIGLLFFFSCSSAKEIAQNQPPFKILKSTYTSWVGGQPGVKGVMVYIEIDNPEILLDTVYFRNAKSPLERAQNSKGEKYVGHFSFPEKERDLVLHSDATKEFGNQVPDISQKIPFELKSNEAVISYNYNGKINYFKIDNLIEEKKKMR